MAPHTTLHDPLMAQEKPTYFTYKGPEDFSTAIDVARHYGFHLTEPIEPEEALEKKAKERQGEVKKEKTGEWYIHLEDKFAELKKYIEDMQGWPQPALICHTLHPRRKVGKLRLNMFGCQKTVSEGLVIAASLAVLRELGHENLGIEVNCVGSSDTKLEWSHYFKEHIRQNLADIRPTCREIFKQDPLRLTSCQTHKTCQEIIQEAPKTVNHLNENDRKHLKDICEYLEAVSVPYRIKNSLVGSHHHNSHTIFNIRKFSEDGESESPVLARGERHHSVAGKMGFPRSIPTISASIDVPGGRRQSFKSVKPEEVEQPNIYYVHIGNAAKKQSLSVLEKLRQEGITVLQSLTRDKIRDQISAAERLKVPHAVIMGKKEAEEKAVIVRDMFSKTQKTIAVDKLSKYLKKVA